MNEEQLARIPTIERFEADLNDIEQQLILTRDAIDYGETAGDPLGFIDARKRIAGTLDVIQNARQFIAARRHYLASLTPDVASLFLDDLPVRQIDVPEADRRLQGGGTAG